MTARRKRQDIEGPYLWDILAESPLVSEDETRPAAETAQRRKATPAPSWICELFQRILARYVKEDEVQIRVEFYPYAGLKNSARYNKQGILFRLSDLMQNASREVIEATGYLLLARLHNRKCPKRYERIYYDFTRSDEMDEASHNAHVERRRVSDANPKGFFYDLRDSFARINDFYYKGGLPEFQLTWSKTRASTLLGHHDGHLNRITITRALDHPKVPEYVLDYVMFHEILHFVIPIQRRNGRRIVHPPKFQKAEKKYRYYQKALKWIDRNL